MQTIGVIADIHANSWALKAVLEDISRYRINGIINLGDSLYGPLDPAGTFDLLKNRDVVSISGNMDRDILEAPARAVNATMQYVLQRLDHHAMEWLQAMPSTFGTNNFFACHGTPDKDDEPLLEQILADKTIYKTAHELEYITRNIPQPLILCAHTHVPGSRYLSNNKILVNPGSVGLPAYNDDLPFTHQMVSGTPHAKYCLVESDAEGVSGITWRALKYDWREAARAARDNGREDWAYSLETGRAL